MYTSYPMDDFMLHYIKNADMNSGEIQSYKVTSSLIGSA